MYGYKAGMQYLSTMHNICHSLFYDYFRICNLSKDIRKHR